MALFRSHLAWILPLVLLVVALFEDLVSYKVRQHVQDPYARAAIIFVFTAFAFGIAAGWLGPRIRDALTRVRQKSRSTAGKVGLVAFYVLAYGGLYYAYVVVERVGSGGLLPGALR